MKNTKQTWVIGALILLVSACAKDKNVDDWRAEKAKELTAKIQSAAGVYQGALTSSKDGSVLGGLSIDIESNQVSQPNPDGTGTESVSRIVGKISFIGGDQALNTFVFSSASYNPDDGSFNANIPVPLDNGKSGEIDIIGTVAGAELDGRLQAIGYPELGGTFQLSRGGDMQAAASRAPKSDPNSADPSSSRSYAGKAVYTKPARTVDMTMDVDLHESSTEESFFNRFSPKRHATVTTHLSTGVNTPIDAVVDDVSGNIIGSITNTSNDGPLRGDLNCKTLKLAGGALGWRCDYKSAGIHWKADLAPTQNAEN